MKESDDEMRGRGRGGKKVSTPQAYISFAITTYIRPSHAVDDHVNRIFTALIARLHVV